MIVYLLILLVYLTLSACLDFYNFWQTYAAGNLPAKNRYCNLSTSSITSTTNASSSQTMLSTIKGGDTHTTCGFIAKLTSGAKIYINLSNRSLYKVVF